MGSITIEFEDEVKLLALKNKSMFDQELFIMNVLCRDLRKRIHYW